MATKETKKTNNPYAGKSVSDLQKEYQKLNSEYEQSLSKGKMTSQETPVLRKKRAQLLTALNQAQSSADK
tara:strand:+ start:380 stop:589 length:210 start_codon:yes stop_codon:yes gene_type:complete